MVGGVHPGIYHPTIPRDIHPGIHHLVYTPSRVHLAYIPVSISTPVHAVRGNDAQRGLPGSNLRLITKRGLPAGFQALILLGLL